MAGVGASTIVGLMPSSQITTLRVEMQGFILVGLIVTKAFSRLVGVMTLLDQNHGKSTKCLLHYKVGILDLITGYTVNNLFCYIIILKSSF